MLRKYCLTFCRNYANWATAPKGSTRSPICSKFVSEFKDFYPKLIGTAISQTKYLVSPELKKRLQMVSEYYTLKKFPLQGELFIYAYELLENPENINDEMVHQVYTLACALETFQSYFIIQDDIVDNSQTRCGKTCWHLLPGGESLTVNDTSMLRSFINEYLKRNIDKAYYRDVLDIINEMYFKLEIGQYYDLSLPTTKDYTNYTRQYYDLTHVYKSSYYSVISNILLALTMTNKATEEAFRRVEDLCDDFGIFVQIHNDYTDYIDVEGSISGKTSTDIQNGKCSWLAIAALEHCNPEQRKVFEECYGSWDPEDVKRIRQLYTDLDIATLYRLEEQSRYETYLRKAHNLPADSTPSSDFFIKIFEFIRSYSHDPFRYYYI